MIPRALFASTVLLFGMNLYSQQLPSVQEQPAAQQPALQAVDEKPPTDLNNDNGMVSWLLIGDKLAEHMTSLGVESGFAEKWTSAAEERSGVYPRFKSFRTGTNRRAAVLFLPCIPFLQTAYLYLLAPDDHAWKVSDKLELDCHYDDNVSFEIDSIIDPQRDEIEIHHACGGHGTGYLEQNFSVYSVAVKKFKLEMETDEVLHEHPAGGSPLELDQSSTFTTIPITGSRLRVIEETRRQIRNGKLTVHRRLFRWNPAHARYEPSPFALIEAATK
jgi:hypothetical protein